jgi:hypothetical protein
MPVFERAHTFQVVKSALKPLPVDAWLILDVIGTQLYCSTSVDSLMFDWRSLFDSAWYGFCNLAIVTFHYSIGAEIKNTTTASDAAVLLPIQNGAKSSCCQKDVYFLYLWANHHPELQATNSSRWILSQASSDNRWYARWPQHCL